MCIYTRTKLNGPITPLSVSESKTAVVVGRRARVKRFVHFINSWIRVFELHFNKYVLIKVFPAQKQIYPGGGVAVCIDDQLDQRVFILRRRDDSRRYLLRQYDD